MTSHTTTGENQDEGPARIFVAGVFVYAILMICLFALPGADFMTGLLPMPGMR